MSNLLLKMNHTKRLILAASIMIIAWLVASCGREPEPLGGNKFIGQENATIRGGEVHSRQAILVP
jgi:hypothetical protein